jgi:hypothetical protein
VNQEASKRGLSFESMGKGKGVEYGFVISNESKKVYGNILSTEMQDHIYQAVTKSLYQFYDSNGSKNFVILVDTIQNHFLVMPFEILKKVMYERRSGDSVHWDFHIYRNPYILRKTKLTLSEYQDNLELIFKEFENPPMIHSGIENEILSESLSSIYLSAYPNNNLEISKKAKILGWKQHPGQLAAGDFVFVFNTDRDTIECCFELKSISNDISAIWKGESENNIIYKYRWNTELKCDGLGITTETIYNFEPFNNDKKLFSLLIRNITPRSLEGIDYTAFRSFLSNKCEIPSDRYLLLLKQQDSKWDDKQYEYHFANTVANYKLVVPGAKSIFFHYDKNKMCFLGHGQISSVVDIGEAGKTKRGTPIIRKVAKHDFTELNVSEPKSAEFEDKIRVLPKFNIQNSIRRIPKSIFDLVVNEFQSEHPYTLEELSAKSFIEPNIFEEWEELLNDKKQIIFYGPPGTGKTFVATEFSKYLISKYGGTYEIVQFHPSYSYEDFVEGIKPRIKNGILEYAAEDAIFKKFCRRATLNSLEKYILIIDEINRGNLSKIFGELVYSLEYRGEEGRSRKQISLPYTNEHFTIPENIWIIGTMNSADRSIALVDYALRRRFYFIELMPNADILDAFFTVTPSLINKYRIIQFFKDINETITKDEKLGRHFQLGHSYFMRANMDEKMIKRIWRYAVKPILEEYYFEEQDQIDKFEQLLKQTIKTE